MKKKISKEASKEIIALTEGVFSYVVDVSLWITAYSLELTVPRSTGNIWKAQMEADRLLQHINYDVLKEALKRARARGWIKKTHRRNALPEITKEGRERLASLVPKYREKRTWDERMYLVTYDIPETHRKQRNILRESLLQIGCGRLQDSVWITPYDPADVLRELIQQNNLQGTVILSTIGKDGSIGDENLHELIIRIYHLDEINDRYKKWIDEVKTSKIIDHWMVLKYVAILQDDPQLPFSLLPLWWQGDSTYQLVKSKLK